MAPIRVDRDINEHGYGRGRWWNANPKSAKPSHFRERGEVPDYLWHDYADALKAERRAHKERVHAERQLNDNFRAASAPKTEPATSE